MQRIVIRQVKPEDFESIRALNQAEVHHTSLMDLERVRALDSISCYHKVACVNGVVAAFLLAMRSGAPYQNDNFAWFAKRYSTFLYVDRIVVSAAYGGLTLGSRLYTDLFAYAHASEINIITCEYNICPPNERSRRFHDRFGFKELDTQWVSNGSKQVSLQAAGDLNDDQAP
jgi:predicted GNAT superfamily acetyltransferase